MLVAEIEERTDTQGVSTGEIVHHATLSLLTSDKDSILPMESLVEELEVLAQLDEERKDDCTIRPRIHLKLILLSQLFVVVDLSVGNHCILIGRREEAEGLFSLEGKVVDGQPVEADDAGSVDMDDGVVRSSGFHLFESSQLLGGQLAAVNDRPNATHLFLENL